MECVVESILTKICTKCFREFSATKEHFSINKRGKYGLCAWCKECSRSHGRQYMIGYYTENSESIKAYQKSYKLNNHEMVKSRERNRNHRNKLSTISHYGGQCAICGETNPSFLCIDHINNDGAEHRKLGIKGSKFYRWVIKNDFPTGFQVLCWNHNWLKNIEHRNELNKNTPKAIYDRLVKSNLKIDAIKHYGGRCVCCGEDNFDLLSIDHVNGKGNKHRKEIGRSRFYAWLKCNNYPIEFRVLCLNCNCGRSINGDVCPHKEI